MFCKIILDRCHYFSPNPSTLSVIIHMHCHCCKKQHSRKIIGVTWALKRKEDSWAWRRNQVWKRIRDGRKRWEGEIGRNWCWRGESAVIWVKEGLKIEPETKKESAVCRAGLTNEKERVGADSRKINSDPQKLTRCYYNIIAKEDIFGREGNFPKINTFSRSSQSLASVRTTRHGVSTQTHIVSLTRLPDLSDWESCQVCARLLHFFPNCLGLHDLDKVIGLIIILLNVLCSPEAVSASFNHQGQVLHA